MTPMSIRIMLVGTALLAGSASILSIGATRLAGYVELPNWTVAVLPPDFAAARAQEIARHALANGDASEQRATQDLLERILSLSPYNGALWLSLARLRAIIDINSPFVIAALKLCYLTAPTDLGLMEARSRLATSAQAISDQELGELVKGDIRLIATRRPDLAPALLSVYRQASPDGRAFLSEAVRAIDPNLASKLSAQ